MWCGATPGGLCRGTRGWHGGSSWMAWGLVVDGMGACRGWRRGSSWVSGHNGPHHPCDTCCIAGILAPGLFGLAGSVGWDHVCTRVHVTLTCDVRPGLCVVPEKVYKPWPFHRCLLRVCPNLIASYSFVLIINYYCEVD